MPLKKKALGNGDFISFLRCHVHYSSERHEVAFFFVVVVGGAGGVFVLFSVFFVKIGLFFTKHAK